MSVDSSSSADERATQVVLERITTIHTLGPAGTNLEMASRHWFAGRSRPGTVVLHSEVEHALEVMRFDGSEAIMACAVYPRLHELVFQNLHRLAMIDTFLRDTYDMVLATRAGVASIATVVSHPAPSCLAAGHGTVTLTSSNSKAAQQCRAGLFDACITTGEAAHTENLAVVHNFGPVPMAFTLHVGHSGRPGTGAA